MLRGCVYWLSPPLKVGGLGQTFNQAENDGVVCTLLFSGFKKEVKKNNKEAFPDFSNRSGFRADWSKNHIIQRSLLRFNRTGSQICLFLCGVSFQPFAGLTWLDPFTFGLYILVTLAEPQTKTLWVFVERRSCRGMANAGICLEEEVNPVDDYILQHTPLSYWIRLPLYLTAMTETWVVL